MTEPKEIHQLVIRLHAYINNAKQIYTLPILSGTMRHALRWFRLDGMTSFYSSSKITNVLRQS